MGNVRLQYIDILKGMGIFFVVLGHTTQNKELFNLIYAFHMPLFFIISGIFLHNKAGFICKYTKSLLIPYLSFGVLSFVYWWLVENHFRELPIGETFFSQFVNLFIPTGMQHCNVVLWFLPCLFIACVTCNYLNSKITSKGLKILILLGLICSVGYLGDGYPFYVGQASQAIPYVLVGSLFLGGKISIVNNLITCFKTIAVVVSLIGLLIIYFSGVTCDMLSCLYSPCYSISFVVGLLGFISFYILAFCLQKNIILSWLGKNSLAIMLIHEPIKRVLIKLYSIVLNIPMDILRESILNSIIMATMTILISIPLVSLLNNKFPCLLGKKKKNEF